MRKTVIISIVVMVSCFVGIAETDSLVSNVYSQVQNVYANHWLDPPRYFSAVRGGGVLFELEGNTNFLALTHFVSNHCAEIAADWRSYETNEMVRFTVMSAAGNAGLQNWTNLAERIMTFHEANTNACSWKTIEFLCSPSGTHEMHSMILNYDVPLISNLLLRIKAEAIRVGDTNFLNGFDDILSGAHKQWLLEMKAAGAL